MRQACYHPNAMGAREAAPFQENAMTKYLVSTFAAAMMLSAVAVADDPGKSTSADATFKSLDRDADQRLSKSEASSDSMLSQHFAAVDADSDGFLTKREYTAHMKDMKGKDEPKKNY
jgi:hypothetical protein